MGVQFKELLVKKELDIKDLKGKVIAIDAANHLYQFLTSIRQRDGTPLTDSKGNITSHLVGLFSRTTKMMNEGMKVVYVFDGIPPALKREELQKRKDQKTEAQKRFDDAKERGDEEEMKKYGARTARLTEEMKEEAKKLILALGIPVVQAPSEGEAQAAFMVKKGDAYAVGSQDADSLLNGTPRLIRNLSYIGKRKLSGKFAYKDVAPELINLDDNLKALGIDNDQLIVLAMLIGTDYNTRGIPGLGPKKGLKMVKDYNKDFDKLFNDVKWSEHYEYEWQRVFDTIKNMPTVNDYKLEWKAPNIDDVKKVLVEGHDFAEERINSSFEKIVIKPTPQKNLFDF